jgi:hypothetical protein
MVNFYVSYLRFILISKHFFLLKISENEKQVVKHFVDIK